MPARAPVDVRICRNVVPGYGGCWIWTGERRTGGYGYIEIDGKAKRVHRVSYETFVGPVPDGMVVMHACDERRCVNPTHLSVGTFADNNRDMREKGRGAPPPSRLGISAPTGPRKTHCAHGHLLPPYEPGVRRRCRICNNEQQRHRRGLA